jgi:ferredoxin
MILELLLASCPQSKVIQDLASAHGVRKQRFKQEHEDCILCGLCVRVCAEQMMAGATVKLVGMARGPIAAAMVGKTIGRTIREQQAPVYIERFGNSIDSVFVTASALRTELGSDALNKLRRSREQRLSLIESDCVYCTGISKGNGRQNPHGLLAPVVKVHSRLSAPPLWVPVILTRYFVFAANGEFPYMNTALSR